MQQSVVVLTIMFCLTINVWRRLTATSFSITTTSARAGFASSGGSRQRGAGTSRSKATLFDSHKRSKALRASTSKEHALIDTANAAGTSTLLPPSPPLKIHIFVDGTWLYYTLIVGRNNNSRWRSCPVEYSFGPKWRKTHQVDWIQLPQIIASQVAQQLALRGTPRAVEVVRTSIFTSALENTPILGLRATAIEDWYKASFDVHLLRTPDRPEGEKTQEKCVDIQIAVEMVYMATVPNAYDVAVLVSGDKDFIPALQKTRQMAKRVAIASVRNSCNKDLTRQDLHIKDFDVIWIEDHIQRLVVSKSDKRSTALSQAAEERLRLLISSFLQSLPEQSATSREVGRYLQSKLVTEGNAEFNALQLLKEAHGSIRSFIEQYDEFKTMVVPDNGIEYRVQWNSSGRGEELEQERGLGKILGDVVEDDDDDDEDGDGDDGDLAVPFPRYIRPSTTTTKSATQNDDSDASGETDSEGSSSGGGEQFSRARASEAFAKHTVAMLREEAETRGLEVRARASKKELLDKILDHAQSAWEREEKKRPASSDSRQNGSPTRVITDADVVASIKEFLSTTTDPVNSRDLGRSLQAKGMLKHIKNKHSSLRAYLFTLEDEGVSMSDVHSKQFFVELKK